MNGSSENERTWTVELGRGRWLVRAGEQLSRFELEDFNRSMSGAVVAAAQDAGVPTLMRAHVIAEYRPAPPRTGKKKREFSLFEPAGEILPSAKAAVASLASAGVLPRDPERLTGPVMRLGEVVAGSQLVLHIAGVAEVPQ